LGLPTAAQVSTQQILPGTLLAADCCLGLQALGGAYVTQVLAGSSQTYGGFVAVAGLLSWLLIASELILIAAELNVSSRSPVQLPDAANQLWS
jgi:membrane protein